MTGITTCLCFQNSAEEAAEYYCSIFPDSSVNAVTYYTEGGMGNPGDVLTVSFTLKTGRFMAFNGPAQFQLTPAISLMVECENQDEIDYYWEKLSEGGLKERCGWVKDKFGVSWQIVPVRLLNMLNSGVKEKTAAVTLALLRMYKLIITELEEAFNSSQQ
ncbi:MAG: VOC family protein [Ignavibacteriaceae bacterium]|nr:VOC family protein [Ignavibacteriaceae bacterium]